MPQIIEENRKKSFMDRLGSGAEALGHGIGEAIPAYLQGKQAQERQAQISQKVSQLIGMDVNGLPPEMQQKAFEEYAKNEAKSNSDMKFFNELGYGNESNYQNNFQEPEQNVPSQTKPRGILKPEFENSNPEKSPQKTPESQLIPQNKIDAMSIRKPALARSWQARNDNIIKQQIHEQNYAQKEQENARKADEAIQKDKRGRFESDRDFNTKFSFPVIQDAQNDSKTLPIQEAAMSNMIGAIKRGDDVGFMSSDWWADFSGIDAFRTMTGAQLQNAAKEFLLSSVGQAGSRPNQWIEQRILSMAPSIGKTKIANATYAEGLKEALDLKRFYVNKVNELSLQNFKEHGYGKADIAIRASQALDEYAKERQEITKYRMQDLYEKEHNIKSVEDLKTVSQGTPITRRVKNILKKEFGANALEAAKRLGYEITPKGFAEKAESR